MPDLVVIFRTQSDVEASIVRGLLEAHGIPSVVASDVPHNVFPLAVSDLGEVRLSVRAEDAEEARHVIDGHRTETHEAPAGPIRREFETLQVTRAEALRDNAAGLPSAGDERLELGLARRVDERLDRDVVAGPRLREQLVDRALRLELEVAAGKHLLRAVLRGLHVRLVERID